MIKNKEFPTVKQGSKFEYRQWYEVLNNPSAGVQTALIENGKVRYGQDAKRIASQSEIQKFSPCVYLPQAGAANENNQYNMPKMIK